MIVAEAKQVLVDARFRRSSDECERIGRKVLFRAEQALNLRFSEVEKIVDNRNSVCFRAVDGSRAYLLKVNKFPGTQAVHGAALRMNSISTGQGRSAFSVPVSHYMDHEFDAALMSFIDGKRLDVLLRENADADVLRGLVRTAAVALSAIHHLSPDAPLVETALPTLVHDVESAFPAFAKRNRVQLERLGSLTPAPSVSIHGDFSPKNLFLSADGTLSVIDFTPRPVSSSPLRDVSVFAIGMARALTLSSRLRLRVSTQFVEMLLHEFLDEYLSRSPQIARARENVTDELTLFELARLVETMIWLNGYGAFSEKFVGWVKAQAGRVFLASQLKRLQERLG